MKENISSLAKSQHFLWNNLTQHVNVAKIAMHECSKIPKMCYEAVQVLHKQEGGGPGHKYFF